MSDEPKEDDWQDLQECWELIHRKSPIHLVTDKVGDIKGQLDIACAKTAFELSKYAKQYEGKPLTPEMIIGLVSQAAHTLTEKWFEGLQRKNLAGLIEFVLEGQDLSLDELKGFLGALPRRFLDRVVESGVGVGSGVHGVAAIEIAMRDRNIRDYRLRKKEGKIVVEFNDPKRDYIVVEFELGDSINDNSATK